MINVLFVRKTNLFLKVGRSGLGAKLNVTNPKFKKNQNKTMGLQICKIKPRGNIFTSNRLIGVLK